MKGKHIVIVGGAVGFGRSLGINFAKRGACVYLFDQNPQVAEVAKVIRSEGGRVEYKILDVCEPRLFPSAFKEVFGENSIDGLLYLPRAREGRDFRQTTPETWDNDLNVALKGAFFCAQSLLPYLERNASADRFILFVSSVLSEVIGIESVGYHVAKAGLNQLTRYLAVNLGPLGIRVNAIQIGLAIKDESLTYFGSQDNRDQRELFVQIHPLKKVGNVQNIFDAALFLASEQAGFITGQILGIDGGLILQEPIYLLNRMKRVL